MIMKLKDYFTAGNIVCGCISVFLVIEGQKSPTPQLYVDWAAYFIMFGWVFDFLDGHVARLTKQFNKFGAEFDNIADLINYSVAPAFVIFGQYIIFDSSLQGKIIAGVLALFPPIFGAIRIARFNIKRIEYPGVWFGLPRPASAFLIINLFGLSLFKSHPEIGYFFIPFMSYSNLSLYPFVGHHKRKFNKWWIMSIAFIMINVTVVFVLHLLNIVHIFYETTFLWFLSYYLTYPVLIPKDEKVKLKEFVKNWLKEEKELL